MAQFFVDYGERVSEVFHEFATTITGVSQEGLDYTPGTDMNSLCVLVAHATGSARFWVGDIAMGESSNRNRASEFQAHGWSEAELLAKLRDCEAYICNAVERLTLSELDQMRVNPFSGESITAGWALLHALEHTSLHLGHAQITRQLWDQRR